MVQENTDLLLYATRGSSMFPFIRGGDYVLVKKVPPETMQPGDTIVFESGTQTKVCHRLVGIEKIDNVLWFHTKGYKNSPYKAYLIRQEKVLGKVVSIKRKAGIVELSTHGLQSLLFKFDCLFTENIFCIKKILAKVTLLKKIYRYTNRR